MLISLLPHDELQQAAKITLI